MRRLGTTNVCKNVFKAWVARANSPRRIARVFNTGKSHMVLQNLTVPDWVPRTNLFVRDWHGQACACPWHPIWIIAFCKTIWDLASATPVQVNVFCRHQ
jgi:hypothetical protein